MRWLWLCVMVAVVIENNPVSSLCKNEYADGITKILVGRPAIYNPPKGRYSTHNIVRFRCPEGYHFQEIHWRRKKMIWIECGTRRWRDPWPTCRGPMENVTCDNEYKVTYITQKTWQNPTANQHHAIYTPERESYPTLTSVKFTCPRGMFFKGTKGLSSAESTCREDRTWSREWPMCKGHTCDPLHITNAIVDNGEKRLSPGTVINIRCHYGYYLRGLNQSTCTYMLVWSGYPRECVTLDTYKEYCEQSYGTFKFDGKGEPVCLGEKLTTFALNKNDRTKRITLSIAIPLSALFIILLTTSSLYVRRLRLRQQRMAATVLYQNADETVNLVLPSYEDAMKSKPTTPPPTFEETFSFSEPSLDVSADSDTRIRSQPLRYGSPPPYE